MKQAQDFFLLLIRASQCLCHAPWEGQGKMSQTSSLGAQPCPYCPPAYQGCAEPPVGQWGNPREKSYKGTQCTVFTGWFWGQNTWVQLSTWGHSGVWSQTSHWRFLGFSFFMCDRNNNCANLIGPLWGLNESFYVKESQQWLALKAYLTRVLLLRFCSLELGCLLQ